MPTPFESRAIEILDRKPLLRWTLIVVALIGVTKGAYDTLSEIVKPLIDPIKRYLPLTPTDAEADRFTCAVKIPRLIRQIDIFALRRIDPRGSPDDLARQHFVNFRRDILYCHRTLGFASNPPKDISYSKEQRAESISIAFDDLLQTHAAFKGYISAVDRPAAKLLALSEQVESLHYSLQAKCNSVSIGRCADELEPDMLQLLENIRFAHRQVATTYPYRFFGYSLKDGDRFQLRDSVLCYRMELIRKMGPLQPERVLVSKTSEVKDSSRELTQIEVPMLNCPPP